MRTVRLANLAVQNAALKFEVLSEIEKLADASAFILGEAVNTFETRFAEFCGVQHACGVGNGTDALTLTLKALDIGPGHEVITAANSFIATAEAICHAGATPVFADIDPATYNIDAERAAERITPKTKAIIPVHLYGQPADMSRITRLAQLHGLFVVEDSSQAHGAAFAGKRAGSLGHAACFSFYPSKNLGAWGDAGAVVTSDAELALRIRRLRDHGGIRKYQHDLIGFNSRMDAIQAVVLNAKLHRLEEWNQWRRKIAQSYDAGLAMIEGVTIPRTLPGAVHVYHQYVIRVASGLRDSLRAFLSGEGIETGIHYPVPIHLTPAMKHLGYREGDIPFAEACARSILSLPIYPEMKEAQVSFVIRKISDFTQKGRLEKFALAAGAS
jgi:dTDP-4-amino-4,6-dideoxygalactose transaminase